MKNIIGLIICLIMLCFLFLPDKKSTPIKVDECMKFIYEKPYKHRKEIRTGYQIQSIKVNSNTGNKFEITLEKRNLLKLGIIPLGKANMKREDELIFHLEEGEQIVYDRSFSSKSKGYYIGLPVYRGIGLKGKKGNYQKLENYPIKRIQINQSSHQIQIDLNKKDSELLNNSFRCLAELGE